MRVREKCFFVGQHLRVKFECCWQLYIAIGQDITKLNYLNYFWGEVI